MTTLCQSVMSFHSPLCWSLVRRAVASENLETEMPLGVNLVSASLPRFPSRRTLLTLRAIVNQNFNTPPPGVSGYLTATVPAAPQAARADRASSLGKSGETAPNDCSRYSRDAPHDPLATAAR